MPHGDARSKDDCLAYAGQYLQAGLSVIPIRTDGSKAPSIRTWKEYQARLPTQVELRQWFGRTHPPGIAILCGTASGNLEVIDFDQPDLYNQWLDLVGAESWGLTTRLTVVRTPEGVHVYYRCPEIAGNDKLARRPPMAGELATDKNYGPVTLIETRGEGGYVLAPGSPPACHPTNRTYEHTGGPPLTDVQTICAEERELLHGLARSLNRWFRPGTSAGRSQAGNWGNGDGRPGDDFNVRATWSEILEPRGWQVARRNGETVYWRRPGKDGPGQSATTGFCRSKSGEELLHVFSSNANPFESESTYSKFAAYALLNHGGDFGAAAKALAEQGYGDKKYPKRNEDAADKELWGYDLIFAYLREKYQPVFRRGPALYSARFKREVKQAEACQSWGLAIIERLESAVDAPTHRGGALNRGAFPHFFSTWAKGAYADLLEALPEEEEADEVSGSARDEFEASIAAGLATVVTLAYRYPTVPDRSDKQWERVERNSLLEWCRKFAKPGKWAQIRSYYLWTCLGTDGRLRIALRPELFGQDQHGELRKLSFGKFADLAELYDIGTRGERPCGQRAVELTQRFLEDRLPKPETGVDATTAKAAKRQTASTAKMTELIYETDFAVDDAEGDSRGSAHTHARIGHTDSMGGAVGKTFYQKERR